MRSRSRLRRFVKATARFADLMRKRTNGGPAEPTAPAAPPETSLEGTALPMIGTAQSQFAEVERPVLVEPTLAPRKVERGVVAFDLDGTILDDMGLISSVAADVFFQAFGTPPNEGRLHYLATTGMPFEAQLSQLYPESPPAERARTARTFHERKVREAYAQAKPFPEMPKVLRRLSQNRWTLVISTGAEREMADLMLEREGLRYWFEASLGSGQGTKREHLTEYRRRFPDVPIFLVGDSRFDMEAAGSLPGVRALGRASRLHDWTLSPDDLGRWGAAWANYTLTELPEALESLESAPGTPPATLRGKTGRRAPARKR
jgi:phosphoglycolate phosphatase-like HAD superfamily hydrolase